MASKKSVKSALESMMFTWGEPLPAKTAAEVLNMHWKDAYDCFKELQTEYEEEGRGIRIREVNKAFQFVTLADNSEYIERLCTPVKQKRLSQSALEVLAIVAYKQPVTRSEVEAIRGIKCDRVLESLEKKELIAEVGRSAGHRKTYTLRHDRHISQTFRLYEYKGTARYRRHRGRYCGERCGRNTG